MADDRGRGGAGRSDRRERRSCSDPGTTGSPPLRSSRPVRNEHRRSRSRSAGTALFPRPRSDRGSRSGTIPSCVSAGHPGSRLRGRSRRSRGSTEMPSWIPRTGRAEPTRASGGTSRGRRGPGPGKTSGSLRRVRRPARHTTRSCRVASAISTTVLLERKGKPVMVLVNARFRALGRRIAGSSNTSFDSTGRFFFQRVGGSWKIVSYDVRRSDERVEKSLPSSPGAPDASATGTP